MRAHFPEQRLVIEPNSAAEGIYLLLLLFVQNVSPFIHGGSSRERKRCPQLELAAYGNVKIQSLYGI